MEQPEREVLDWQTFGRAARELAQSIADDNFRPDLVLSVARGGLLVAGALSYALDVKSIHMLNVLYYTGIDQRLDAPLILDPKPDLADLAAARILIADDVADTGATLETVRNFCAGRVAEVRCAVLYEKPESTVRCEYVWRRTDRWINFPWSSLPPVTDPDAQVTG
ncbi:phosphoribosyltransferase [Dactylosporangium sp. CS-047395]|uniref:phosphoribosyltransferase n=1 Tax=Dactylosporangium sp. CS-047395 TaxID=3239936 RepID=UPI003D8F69F4